MAEALIGIAAGLIVAAIFYGAAAVCAAIDSRRDRTAHLAVTLTADARPAIAALRRAEDGIRSLGRERLP